MSSRDLKGPSPSAAPWPERQAAWLSQAIVRPYLPPIAICIFVFVATVALWRSGHFQFFELQVYDRFLRNHASTSADASPIVIVGISEEDLQRLNSTLIPDDTLTDALQNLLNAQPAAVVLDLYRNLPVPGKDPSGLDRLTKLFTENSNMIAIQRLGLGKDPKVPAPPYLASFPEQVGFNDFSILDVNVDETVRRATLMMWEFDDVYYSDPMLATLLYLQTHNIDYQLNDADSKEFRLGRSIIRPFEANDGAYVNADARGCQILLNFRGPAEFRTFEFTEALTDQIPPNSIRGKVVFVGPLAASLKDFLATPLNKRFPALLLHAHIVNQLIERAITGRPPLRFWSEWQETFWIFAWCVIGTLAGSNVRNLIFFVTVLAACAAALFAIYWFAMLADTWLLVVAPAVGFACAAALNTAHQVYLERSQRDVLMALFAQHVSANIATDIWKHREQFMDGHRPKPQVIQGTVFFTDLKGFTGNAEAMPPEALINWLNEYMEVMSALIEQYDGMVNKYMGDAIMAAFGAPIPRTKEEEIQQDARNAARCALAMARELDRLNKEWNARSLPTTVMRIGIASGPLVSGSIGGSRRLEYTVTGDTVVTAKRLESAEKDSTMLEKASQSCRILVSEGTYNLLGGIFEARKIGPMRLEGKNKVVEVYVLIGEK